MSDTNQSRSPAPHPSTVGDDTPSDTPPADKGRLGFLDLLQAEDAQLEAARTGRPPKPDDFQPAVSTPGAAQEPWVAFTNRDRVGLALSGGGIRSATFNLGLLQALNDKNVLKHVDYLSTVSGGGYVGGFWTAWKHRQDMLAGGSPPPEPPAFPSNASANTTGAPSAGAPEMRERKEIRHLREFSRFLMPRLSPDSVDLWSAVVTILGGMVPSLLFAMIVITCGWTCWLALAQLTGGEIAFGDGPATSGPAVAAAVVFAVVFVVQWGSEKLWREEEPKDAGRKRSREIYLMGATLAVVAGGIQLAVLKTDWVSFKKADRAAIHAPTTAPATDLVVKVTLDARPQAEAVPRVSVVPLLPDENPAAKRHPDLEVDRAWLATPLALAIAGLVGLLARIVHARFLDPKNPKEVARAQSFDHSIARCLALTVLWSGILLLWWAATAGLDRIGAHLTSGVGGAAALVFAFLRKWLGGDDPSAGKGGVLSRLKPALPKFAAYVAVAAAIILVARLLTIPLSAYPEGHLYRATVLCLLGAIGAASFFLLLLNPARIGMHEFYRGRISRCFLGAANLDSLEADDKRRNRQHARQSKKQTEDDEDDYNRQSLERANDDVTLGELSDQIETRREKAFAQQKADPRLAPVHLVCCAANNLAGDHLGTLYRGARSAVVSARGISLGGDTLALDHLNFSAALTASAAAFNSNMGYISMQFGGAVAFLTTALNMRLGLWVPHPKSHGPVEHGLPGMFFLAEMFGYTRADDSKPLFGNRNWLHLSDGNHFENFGLYELVRRHCRHIILSDCGADPESRFDDFARTLRRVREDFGVEIEIDLDVLKPGPDGFARQHLAVGTIHYNGAGGSDKGMLLYFKPVLTGDEPADVLEYKVANHDFPQQTTGDQFYDEPQWESYRRLGQHSGSEAFRFVEEKRTRNPSAVDGIFRNAAQRWQTAWDESTVELRLLEDRAAAFETEFRKGAPAWLQKEFFPEASPGSATPAQVAEQDETSAFLHLLAVAQIMEDVWRLARLETHWAHPVNEGWMAWLNRWSAMPAFRKWWPVLKATCSYGFGKFVRLRLNLALHEDDGVPADSIRAGLRLRLCTQADAGSWIALRWREANPARAALVLPPPAPMSAFVFELLPCHAPGSTPPKPIPVGFALVTHAQTTSGAPSYVWRTDEFHVPAQLDGAGFTARFLDALVTELRRQTPSASLEVTVSDNSAGTDTGSRKNHVQLIEFYKSRKFVLQPPPQHQKLVFAG